MDLCNKWLANSQKIMTTTLFKKRVTPSLVMGNVPEASEAPDSPIRLGMDAQTSIVDLTVMQHMINLVPDKLITNSHQVLDLVNKILSEFDLESAEDTEEATAIALSLLNLVLELPRFHETTETKPILGLIIASLKRVVKSHLDISFTAKNLLMLMRFRGSIELHDVSGTLTDQQAEDRKALGLARQYILTADSPPPVVVQGLELIASLIDANSAVLDIPSLLVMYSSLLQECDEYIHLRVIKAFDQLSYKHPKSVIKDLLDQYVDQNEDAELDQRLRFGEALTKVIQNSSGAFSGHSARTVSEGLLSIAGRRPRRLKSQKKQENKEKLRQKKNAEAEEAWGGDVPQFEDQEMTEDNKILARIVSGWEGKRGTEDLRIRASALSILGCALETNISEIGSMLATAAIDLSIHILMLEKEPEAGILRRCAIMLFLSFIQALDSARGQKLGFGLAGQGLEDVQRIITYVADTDNDGLVKEYARDALVELQAWQFKSIMPVPDTTISAVRGLGQLRTGVRPRIEEVE
jgi:hypothetical protein